MKIVVCFLVFLNYVLGNFKYQNENWNFDGCHDIDEERKLYRQIHRSIRHSDRLSYLTLDSSFLDRLLQLDSKVNVTLTEFIDEGLQHVAQKDEKSNASQHSEDFNVAAFAFSVLSRTSKAQYYEGVDNFLTTNPCWIPLYEPVFEPFMSGSEFLLFVRLPDYSYHATCKLYTAIHAQQFPSVCDAIHLVTYQLPNIGFGHTSLFTMNAMMTALINSKVFTAPTSEPFRSRPYGKNGNNHNQDHNPLKSDGKNQNPLLWSWADPNRCPINTFENNPW